MSTHAFFIHDSTPTIECWPINGHAPSVVLRIAGEDDVSYHFRDLAQLNMFVAACIDAVVKSSVPVDPNDRHQLGTREQILAGIGSDPGMDLQELGDPGA